MRCRRQPSGGTFIDTMAVTGNLASALIKPCQTELPTIIEYLLKYF
jgi:hypothetical protein